MRHTDVRLKSNGDYWQAAYRDSRGILHVKSLGPKARVSKAEANRTCREMAAKFMTQPGAADVGQAPRLHEWLDHYIALRTDLGDKSIDSQREGCGYMRKFWSGLEGCGPDNPRIDAITKTAGTEFRVWLEKQPRRRTKDGKPVGTDPLGKQTVRKHLVTAKAVMKWAKDHELLAANPFDHLRTKAPKLDKEWAYITAEEFERILAACPDAGWRCLFGLTRWAGLRLGEALRLTWQRIDWDAKRLTVVTKKGKETTKERRRTVPIQSALYSLLDEAFHAAPTGATRICPFDSDSSFYLRAGSIIAAAGLPAYAKPFHTLRKNLESEWMDKAPALTVCDWLGNSPAVAAAHYNKATPEQVARITGSAADDEVATLRAEVARLQRELGTKSAQTTTREASEITASA